MDLSLSQLEDPVEDSEQYAEWLDILLGNQDNTLVHIANAIELLQPQSPNQQQNENSEQEDRQMSQKRAKRKLQSISDRAAARENKRRAEQEENNFVEMDW